MRIEEILTEKGMSKAALAEKMNTSRQNINSLLKNPSSKKIEEFAAALDVPVWQLFASPEEVSYSPLETNSDFAAFIRYNGTHYTADSLEEFNTIVEEIRGITK